MVTAPESLTYRVVEGWEQLPDGYRHLDVAGVAVDSRDRVFIITREDPRVIVYGPDCAFQASCSARPEGRHVVE